MTFHHEKQKKVKSGTRQESILQRLKEKRFMTIQPIFDLIWSVLFVRSVKGTAVPEKFGINLQYNPVSPGNY